MQGEKAREGKVSYTILYNKKVPPRLRVGARWRQEWGLRESGGKVLRGEVRNAVYATEAHREDWAQRMYSAISTYIQGKKLPLRAMKRGRYVFIEMDPAKEKKLRADRR